MTFFVFNQLDSLGNLKQRVLKVSFSYYEILQYIVIRCVIIKNNVYLCSCRPTRRDPVMGNAGGSAT